MASIDAAGDFPFTVGQYGQEIMDNKFKLKQAFDKLGMGLELRAVALAMAMQETNTLTHRDRDHEKDGRSDGSANVSLFNFSLDLVTQVGSYSGSPWDLNDEARIVDAVNVIKTGIAKWGVNRFLNFVRGGRTAFQDGHSYQAGKYRNAIKSMYWAIIKDQKLFWDDRRLQVELWKV